MHHCMILEIVQFSSENIITETSCYRGWFLFALRCMIPYIGHDMVCLIHRPYIMCWKQTTWRPSAFVGLFMSMVISRYISLTFINSTAVCSKLLTNSIVISWKTLCLLVTNNNFNASKTDLKYVINLWFTLLSWTFKTRIGFHCENIYRKISETFVAHRWAVERNKFKKFRLDFCAV